MSKRIIYWFRNDLRLDDNEAFWNAVRDTEEILPIYVFDPRKFRIREQGFRKTGINRAVRMIQGVTHLQQAIRDKGGNLMIKVGEPEMIVAELAKTYDVEEVRASKEIVLEETNIEASLSKKLKGINVDISLTWISTLTHPHDLPFYVSRLPEKYEGFKIAVKEIPVRQPVGEGVFRQIDWGEQFSVPNLSELGFTEDEINRVDQSLFEWNLPSQDFKTGKLSVSQLLEGVSHGLISPRQAYHYSSPEEKEELHNQLIWRDYLLYVVLKYGTRLFKPSGLIHKVDAEWLQDKELFLKWANGETGDDEINECMNRLRQTGKLNLAETRKVARYLGIVLGVDWTWGASWFESHLTDYEVALNWGNWNYFVGAGLEADEEVGLAVS